MEEYPIQVKTAFKLYGGKHKGKTIDELREEDPQYLIWLISQPNNGDQYEKYNKKLTEAIRTSFKEKPWILTFGKYKGKTLKEVVIIDSYYMTWLKKENEVYRKILDLHY
jgi:uncharacterized protein (DUF3820 family)